MGEGGQICSNCLEIESRLRDVEERLLQLQESALLTLELSGPLPHWAGKQAVEDRLAQRADALSSLGKMLSK